MFYESDGSETQLYDNTGVEYGTGVFTITINPPVTTNAIIVRRTGLITLCEVEIFGGEEMLSNYMFIGLNNMYVLRLCITRTRVFLIY